MGKFKNTFDPKWWFYDLVKWSGFPGISLYYRIKKIYATKNKKGLYKGKFIICSNHVSYDDPASIVVGFWRRRISFLATKELFTRKKSLGRFFRWIKCISVDKENFDIESIRQAIQFLNKGHILCVFPEGKISPNDDILPFKSGVVMTAFLAEADILPIYINKRAKKSDRKVMVIGDRIKFKDLIKNGSSTNIDQINEITVFLNKKINELKEVYKKEYYNAKLEKINKKAERKNKKTESRLNRKNLRLARKTK